MVALRDRHAGQFASPEAFSFSNENTAQVDPCFWSVIRTNEPSPAGIGSIMPGCTKLRLTTTEAESADTSADSISAPETQPGD